MCQISILVLNWWTDKAFFFFFFLKKPESVMLYKLQTKWQRIKRFIKYLKVPEPHPGTFPSSSPDLFVTKHFWCIFVWWIRKKTEKSSKVVGSSHRFHLQIWKNKNKTKNSTVSVNMIFFSSDHTWYDMDSFRSLQGGFDFYSSSGLMHPSSESFSFGTLKDITLFFFFNSHLQQHNAKTKEQ